MKKILVILTASLFITISVTGQNLFFFGDKSYPCTDTIKLKSNSLSNDLSIMFAREGTQAYIALSLKTWTGVLFTGNLFIYLDDGSVITCLTSGKYEYVDNVTSTVFSLTNEQLSKMKNSNINTVRYSLKCGDCPGSNEEGNYSASNRGKLTKTDVPALLNEFIK